MLNRTDMTAEADNGSFRRFASHRLSALVLIGGVMLGIFTVTRFALLVQSYSEADHGIFVLLGTFALGLVFDLATTCYVLCPVAVYLAAIPERLFMARWHRVVLTCGGIFLTGAMVFGAAAEWVFWEEFSVRFNFIAVDYLVYTHEVVGNIVESYPLGLILSGVAAVTAVLTWAVCRSSWYALWAQGNTPATSRWRWAAGLVAAVLVSGLFLRRDATDPLANRYNRELAGNGLYCFVAAFQANSLDYDHFYRKIPRRDAFTRLRQLLNTPDAEFVSADPTDITCRIESPGPEHRWNVIQITVESLSASYLGVFGNRHNMTPNLDRLSRESIFFTNLLATGTRTVRGMEALTLSVPPTPGRSIVKRPGNGGLFSTGTLFRERGYDVRFIYSGYGYFDNMNAFFAANGFDIIDRASGHDAPVTFANIWGACDQDLYTWVTEAADKAYSNGKPFYHFVMTTSNHRPYTFPEGTVDAPQGHRKSAAMYTDYALAEFLENARSKPWFENTLFVITADHCMSSAGETDIPVKNYHIPLFIYAPALVEPRNVDMLCSQIDVPPTILGLLNWSYESQFYGRNVLTEEVQDGRALVGNYQDLGYLNENVLTVLKPMEKAEAFACDPTSYSVTGAMVTEDLLKDTVAYYETASYRFRKHQQQVRQ
jgi:phosphoglycerol transferase MdoB-like AlkP superfamily enzyme